MNKEMDEQIYGKTYNGRWQTLEQLEAKANAYDVLCQALVVSAEPEPVKESICKVYGDVDMIDFYGSKCAAYVHDFMELMAKVAKEQGEK